MIEEKYTITLTEKESLLLSAGTCIATIASGTPKVFDTIQLNIPQDHFVRKYAEACLLLLDNKKEWEVLVKKLSEFSNVDIRKQTLNDIRNFYSSLPSTDGDCPFGMMNDEICQSHEGNCNLCIIDHAIKAVSEDRK